MVKNLLVSFALMLSLALRAQEESESAKHFLEEIENEIPQLLQDFSIPGAAIAIIENGEIILQKGYGFADIEKGLKVNTKTGFNIGSISKTVAAWGVMKLVHEGKVELDAPAETYLSRWHLPKSEYDSDEVTIRRLLSHTAGLSLHGYPGWSPKDSLPSIEESLNGKNNGPGRVEIIHEPGTKWKYSGGGFTILQLIIEEVSGEKFEDYMQTKVLDPLGMRNSSYKIDDKILAASASEYDAYREAIDFELFTAQAAAGLHTNMEDFSRFALASLYAHKGHQKNNPVLPAEIVQQMMEPAPASNGGYGLGYQIRTREKLNGLSGHGGANSGWHAIFRVDPISHDGFIVFTNGGAGYHLNNLVFCKWITWKTGESPWDGCKMKLSIANKMKQVIDRTGLDQLVAQYTELKKNQPDAYDFSENQLNQFGYYYLGRGELEKAIAIFKLNVEAFPNAYNVYDSYGEALLEKGNKEQAIENYRKSVKLNPGNENGIRVLKDLGVSVDDLILKVPISHLRFLAGIYTAIDETAEAYGDWEIAFEEVEGEFRGNDGDYQYKLIPVGENTFVNPDDGASLVFDTKNHSDISLLLMGKYKFKKIK